MSEPPTPPTTVSETPTTADDPWERYVHSPAFDRDCAMYAKKLGKGSSSDDNGSSHLDRRSLWVEDSSASSVESSRYDVSNLEAHLYYHGIRGLRRQGPKLIFRTSKDVFTAPSGPEQTPRLMRLRPVYEHHKLGKDDLWTTVCSKVVELLDQRNIQHSSIDLARFSWVVENEAIEENRDVEEDEEDEDRDSEDNQDNQDIEDGEADIEVAPTRTVFTPVTIWVGVLPDTLTGEVAFNSSNDILNYLKEHDILDIDVAYRESVAREFSGPQLFEPVRQFNPLKAIIDPVTTALGLPIAGLKTLDSQGTMGFYFSARQKGLYATTARHVLLPQNEGNDAYSYIAGPKKEVVLMGTKAFDEFLESIQSHIGNLNSAIDIWEMEVPSLTASSEGGGPDAEEDAYTLAETQNELKKTRAAINELKNFFAKMKKQWSKPTDRVIGHVVWAPPISVSTAPHGYTKDVCVVKLDEKKFSQNFKGNVLDLGPEIDPVKFVNLMYPRNDAPSDFKYPARRLLRLRGILSADEIRSAPNTDHKGEPVRYVIKRGLATQTTIGCLNGFQSHVRKYFALGLRDSVEAAVYPYHNDSGPFCRGGDSGAIIVDAVGKFVALLTGGDGQTDSSDVTYGSPMHWLWEVIKDEFPDANLYFDGDG